MVNTDDFIKRLEIILDYYSINASAFADKIGVQRSSLSHLLSGRNKPSLDFILKILEVYPEVDLYWILNGKGNFPKNDENLNDLKVATNSAPALETVISSLKPAKDLFSNNPTEEKTAISFKKTNEALQNNSEKEIEKIVFFYKDGTFKTFKPD
ncbi:helix-turn-helix domain-containing protein [Flavobacterium seoulense]|uniref:DNA-binding protein n=1 Tax=Flavobacterium seoulense TaxID=1492738 RepID=A0A066X075_9FLAO|nr:helix-turn-helix domain-containing protein [Flavobacterium seoulense]KDN56300.1 DNA-binding protein [Flavobacterium seoulense]